MQVWVGVDIHRLLNDSVICVAGSPHSRSRESCCSRKLLWRKIRDHVGLDCLPLSCTRLSLFTLLLFHPASLLLHPLIALFELELE